MCPIRDSDIPNFSDRCEGTTFIRKTGRCTSIQCQALRPKRTVNLSRNDFGFDVYFVNTPILKQKIEELGVSRDEFLDTKKEYNICNRHANDIPFEFVNEMQAGNDGYMQINNLFLAVPGLQKIRELIDKLPNTETSRYYGARETLIQDLLNNVQESELTTDIKNKLVAYLNAESAPTRLWGDGSPKRHQVARINKARTRSDNKIKAIIEKLNTASIIKNGVFDVKFITDIINGTLNDQVKQSLRALLKNINKLTESESDWVKENRGILEQAQPTAPNPTQAKKNQIRRYFKAAAFLTLLNLS